MNQGKYRHSTARAFNWRPVPPVKNCRLIRCYLPTSSPLASQRRSKWHWRGTLCKIRRGFCRRLPSKWLTSKENSKPLLYWKICNNIFNNFLKNCTNKTFHINSLQYPTWEIFSGFTESPDKWTTEGPCWENSTGYSPLSPTQSPGIRFREVQSWFRESFQIEILWYRKFNCYPWQISRFAELFHRLFRQDLLVASLFRNFLLAERVMRSYKCSPISYPNIPHSTAQHPMWYVRCFHSYWSSKLRIINL